MTKIPLKHQTRIYLTPKTICSICMDFESLKLVVQTKSYLNHRSLPSLKLFSSQIFKTIFAEFTNIFRWFSICSPLFSILLEWFFVITPKKSLIQKSFFLLFYLDVKQTNMHKVIKLKPYTMFNLKSHYLHRVINYKMKLTSKKC